jgi:hypothetical protein
VHTRTLVAVLSLSALALGCGRKATRADCEAVIDRNVAVQLKAMNIGDPALIAKKQDELRTQLSGEIDTCIGKRVTDGMMTCVKAAETPEQIDKCMR